MSKNETDSERQSKEALGRRDLLKKYGPYTAPLVISMLMPSEAYGHKNGQVYSTVASCGADTGASEMGAVHGPTRPHCMFNGGGGMNAHPITNP